MVDKYLKINIISDHKELIEIVTAQIANDLDIAGLEEGEGEITIYVEEAKYNENSFKKLVDITDIKYSISITENKNWNEEWEKNFEPVRVGAFASILADFHEKIPGVEHEILITPKMSFGTGHHATTFMMVIMMERYNCLNQDVIDFGTGTGILAILAEKMGARSVKAIDCDDWSMENAAENIERNHCNKIELKKADHFITTAPVDVIFANINKNVIVDNFNLVASGLKDNGIVIFSGILAEDLVEIERLAIEKSLLKLQVEDKNNWVCVAFRKAGNA